MDRSELTLLELETLDVLATDDESTELALEALQNPELEPLPEALELDRDQLEAMLHRLAAIGLVTGRRETTDGLVLPAPEPVYWWWALTDKGERVWAAWHAEQTGAPMAGRTLEATGVELLLEADPESWLRLVGEDDPAGAEALREQHRRGETIFVRYCLFAELDTTAQPPGSPGRAEATLRSQSPVTRPPSS